MSDPFRYFESSPEVIRLVVMMYVKYPLSLKNVERLAHLTPWDKDDVALRPRPIQRYRRGHDRKHHHRLGAWRHPRPRPSRSCRGAQGGRSRVSYARLPRE